jgi:NTP pyrophosphatase (non-canonical NTP hydrolase)
MIQGLDEYQQAAGRTAPKPDARDGDKPLAVMALGIAGEAGEVAEIVKKYIGHGHPMDREKLCKELGDVLWYLSAVATLMGFTLSEVATANVEKLKKRYPEGFSHEASQTRTE